MNGDPNSEIFTIGIGGAAGDGVMEAGSNIGLLLKDLGYEVYLSNNYPSLIRGGHNFVRLSFSREKVWNDHSKLDVLISLNEETTGLHQTELNTGAIVFAENFEASTKESLGQNAVVLPMSSFTQEIQAPAIARNSIALGALCCFLDLPLQKMIEVLNLIFKEKNLDMNIKLAEMGYGHLQSIQLQHSKKIEPSEPKSRLIDANRALALGFIAAGLDFYIAYPMTPSSSILHFLAGKQSKDGLKVIQPENEIAAINMALGMAYAGKRAAVGSATGGFALMQEAFSFSGVAELPIAIAVSQRQAPATGSPTHSSQSDLKFVINSGHGEFPRIVIAPGDPEESFRAGAEALNLAWKFQTPVIILLDKILSEHMMTVSFDESSVSRDNGKTAQNSGEDYKRYQFADDGISPIAFPGTPNAKVKVNSYEHDEYGIAVDEPEAVKRMLDKRFQKAKGIETEMQNKETLKVYGNASSENVIIFFGSTKSPLLEAAKYFAKDFKLVQILWLEPFPKEKVLKELSGAKKIICVEGNHNAQLAGLIREKTGVDITDKILRYDSMPFDPSELAEEINKLN